MAEEGTQTIGVFLADDHALVRHGIALIIQGEADMEVVGEVGDGAEAVEAVKKVRPDVVLMDIGMPTISGIEAAKQIIQAASDVRVLMLTMYDQDEYLFRALQAGASGYVLKGAKAEDLLRAIRTVCAGDVFIHPRMATKLVQHYVSRLQKGEGHDRYERLSAREREILPLVADARTDQEIGELLHISRYTVQTYRQRIMQKLDLHSRSQLLKYALQRGLIHLEP